MSFAMSFAIDHPGGEIRFERGQNTPVFTNELWRTTCFEAFVQPDGGAGYFEFNFATSGAWAAYRFAGYRAGMTPLAERCDPHVVVRAHPGELRVEIEAGVRSVEEDPLRGDWRVGVSAIIEDARGGKSYWALAHPGGAPDFHHSDCFALRLPPKSRA